MSAGTAENQDGTFARAAGDRNPVGHWVIWNEPDICVPTHPGFSWNAEPRAAQYLPLLRTGWHAVKNASSDLGVIFGSLGIVDSVCDVDKTGMSFWHDLLEAYKTDPATADNQFYFDHMSVNLHKEPERVGEMIKKYRESLNAEGMTGKEVWLMEMGVPTSTEPHRPQKERRIGRQSRGAEALFDAGLLERTGRRGSADRRIRDARLPSKQPGPRGFADDAQVLEEHESPPGHEDAKQVRTRDVSVLRARANRSPGARIHHDGDLQPQPRSVIHSGNLPGRRRTWALAGLRRCSTRPGVRRSISSAAGRRCTGIQIRCVCSRRP